MIPGRSVASNNVDIADDKLMEPLRQAYWGGNGRAILRELTEMKLVDPYVGSRELVSAILDRFYANEDNPLCTAQERERTVIAILASRGVPASSQAIHFYWALMEGVSLKQIAETLVLAGMYSGIDAYASGIQYLLDTVHKLKTRIEQKQDLSPKEVINYIVRPPSIGPLPGSPGAG